MKTAAERSDQQLIDVTIDQITTYENNTRLTVNPKKTEIKIAIAQQGITSPFSVTRRPGHSKYTIAKGGNTRLEVLRELYQETGDDQFHRIKCYFTPFVSELDLLTGHFIENDARGEMIFIERALLADKITSEIKAPGDSFRVLSEKINQMGIKIHYSTLPVMQYAVSRLYPLIPGLLTKGMGRPVIRKIASVEKAVHKLLANMDIPRELGKELFSYGLDAINQSNNFDFSDVNSALK